MKLVNAETKENGRALPNGIGNMVRLQVSRILLGRSPRVIRVTHDNCDFFQKSSHDNTLNIDAVLPKLTTLEKVSRMLDPLLFVPDRPGSDIPSLRVR